MSPWLNMLLRAKDVRFALGTFVVVLVLANMETKLRASSHLLDVGVGVGIAALAVVLAALSILVAFLDENFARLLSAAPGGVPGVIRPYVESAVISGLSTTLSVAGLFFWPIEPGWGRALTLAGALGMTVWTVAGTVELVGITARFGRLRARLPEIEDAYKHAAKAAKARKAS